MRTAMAETSIEAYRSFPFAELQRKEREVLEFMKDLQIPLTREQIALRLGWKESQVCGRVNSLVKKKFLEEVEGGKTRSGYSAKLVQLPKQQGELF